ncbi:hypothetical protein NT6N_27300 [Oceaniferula spumae]|uniref:Acyltransferase n=1 Tax=Oceaniferula spumae TaxID=2979115 RepID=A0AAT9FNU6_9BACT
MMSLKDKIIRVILILSSSLLLIHSCIYGAGRGITMIPAGDPLTSVLETVRIGTYFTMLLGMLMWKTRIHAAFWLLLIAILERSFLEYHVSVAKSVFYDWPAIRVTELSWVIIFYAVSYVLPACVLIDLGRKVFSRRPSPLSQS